jgi:hypothetical protein
MATKKKTAETTNPEPADVAAKPARKFPANARKKRDPAETAELAAPEAAAPVAAAAEAPAGEAAPKPEPSQEAIRARAFALWKERGGSAVENWLQAEAELRAQA